MEATKGGGSEGLQVRSEGRLGVIIFDRPEKANALTLRMLDGLAHAVDALTAAPDVGAILLTASGLRHFSAGVDREELARGEATVKFLFGALFAIARTSKPVIAGVGGPAVGAGLLLALSADLVVVGPRASFALPEVDAGIASFAGLVILERCCGQAAALEMALSGRTMSSAEAVRRGLAHALAGEDPNDVIELCRQAGLRLAAKPPAAIALLKRSSRAGREAALEQARAASLASILGP